MRSFFLFLVSFVIPFSAAAQSVDVESLGRPLSDDTKSMYDRYVYFDEAEAVQKTALDQPVFSQTEIADFAVSAVSNALMMSHKDYQQRLQDIERYFTPEGWQQYKKMIDQVKLVETITSEYYSLSSALNGIAMVGAHGNPGEDEPYEWEVVVPLILTYSRDVGSSVETYPFEMMVRITVRRAEGGPTWQNVKISAWDIVRS